MYNEFSFKFLSKKENIQIIRNIISVIALENNPTVTFINELKTVVSEVVTNSIVHGYLNEQLKYINVYMVMDDEKVAIRITDNGVGIEDVDKAKEPLYSTKRSEERSGLGFTIMELFTDLLIVNSEIDKGTEIYFEKNW